MDVQLLKDYVMKKKLLVGILVLALLLLWSVAIGCPIYRLLGVTCPGCGMTRGILCLLRLDFASAFKHHPLCLLLAFETLYVVFRGAIVKWVNISKKAELTIGIFSLCILLIVWVFRQFIV